MECLFPDFDYAVIAADGSEYIIPRNEETAFLTKHLRVYGGEGNYNGYKVGRLLKNMIFSGKGYVDKPANPESVIFTDDKPNFNFSAAKRDSSVILKNGVDNINSGLLKKSAAKLDNLKEKEMSDSNDFYKSQLEETKSELAKLSEANVKLQNQLAETNVEQSEAKISSLSTQVEALEAQKAELSQEVTEANEKAVKVSEELAKLTEANTKLEEAIEAAKTEQVFAGRVSDLVDLGVDKEDAIATVEKFKNLDTDQFSEIAKVYASTLKTEGEFPPKDKKDEKDKDKKKEDAKADEEVLEDAEVDSDGDDVGATESDNESEAEEVFEALSSYFSDSFNVSEKASN